MMKRLKTLLMSFGLGLITSLTTSPIVVADDTEVYTRQLPTIEDTRPEDARPNILFIFDRSGSMNWVDYASDGTPLYDGKKRIERLKEAFLMLMDEVEGVNVGFGSFTGNGKRGAAINFPITDVDASASSVTGEEDLPPQVSVRIESSEDDAEQDTTTGKMTLDSDNLELTRFSESEEFSIELEVPSYMENMIREGLTGSKTGRGYPGNNGLARFLGAQAHGEGLLALRYPNIDMPQEANITNATIEFYSVENKSTEVTMMVRGAAIADPPVPNISQKSNTALTKVADGAYPITAGANAWNSFTDAKETWELPVWQKNTADATTTVDVTSIVQEIVNNKGIWSGNGNDALGFLFERAPLNESQVNAKTGRKFSNSSGKRPKLNITYTEPGSEAQQQIIGLRFNNVRVLQGATIRGAKLDFISGAGADENAKFTIAGEKVPHSAAFTDTDNDLSQRSKTTASVEWQTDAWNEDETYSTVDISAVIQEIVQQTDWCGGNSLSLFITSEDNPLRNARAFDHADADTAASLKIDYAVGSNAATACIKNTYTTRVKSSIDDAEEIIDGQAIAVSSPVLQMTTDATAERIVGLRFTDMPLNKGTKIINASLSFRAAGTLENNSDPAFLEISAEKSADAAPFGRIDPDTGEVVSSGIGNISQRNKTNAVKWTITEPWQSGERYETPAEVNTELTEIIQQVVNQSGWQPSNDMAIFIAGEGLREVSSADIGNEDYTVRLKLDIQGPLSSGEGDIFTTVRERLKELTNEMLVGGGTPLVDAIYEAGQYYIGGEVDIGSSRSLSTEKYNESFRRNRISHLGSWKGSTVFTPMGCTKATAWDKECINERIEGTATYTPPPTPACAKDYIVFLTDGSANGTDAKERVRNLIGGSCTANYQTAESGKQGDPFAFSYEEKYTTDNVKKDQFVNDSTGKTRKDSDEECGTDMVKYLHEKHDITVHTIGFSLGNFYSKTEKSGSEQWVVNEQRTAQNLRAEAYMREWAATGGGNFYEATSADELLNAFRNVIESAKIDSASFAAPTISVSAFENRLSHNDEVYFALFKPDYTPRWHGNIKKFKTCGESCGNENTLKDSKGNNASDSTGKIDKNAISFWSSGIDGPIVTEGGAGYQLQSNILWTNRQIFTLTDPEVNTEPNANRNIPIITGASGETPTGNYIHSDNPAMTKQLLLGGTDADGNAFSEEAANNLMSDEDRERLIEWIRGRDTEDEDNDGDDFDSRWMLGDPLHSSPGAITYGGSKDSPDVRLFFGTNDGLIRMLDAATGKEEWAFLPPELLSIQPALMDNANIGGRLYGMDLSPSFWIRDLDNFGQIQQPNDFVKMYMGMRRGGQSYYALDVTETNDPKLMWIIKGGQSAGFQYLGQTWSEISVARVIWEGEERVVLFFGGGYDLSADELEGGAAARMKFNDQTVGNGVYMVDAETGGLLWKASGNLSDAPNLHLPKMNYAIPSELTLFDYDLDRFTDRLYFGDMGGQVWRIDFDFKGNEKLAEGAVIASVGLAASGDPNDKSTQRRFFYSPLVKRHQCLDQEYFSVAIASGTRPTPLSTRVEDHFFVFKDTLINKKLYQTNAKDSVEVINNFTQQMYNATGVINYATDAERIEAEAELKAKQGWYLELKEENGWIGEKGLASPILNDNDEILFTTYLPVINLGNIKTGQCAPQASDGSSRLYSVKLCSGTAARDFEEPNTKPADGDESTIYEDLGSGVVGDISLYYGPGNKGISSNKLDTLQMDLGERNAQFIFWRQN